MNNLGQKIAGIGRPKYLLIALAMLVSGTAFIWVKGRLPQPLETFDQLSNTERAIAEFNKAIELEPADADGWLYLGHAYIRNGQPDQAIAVLVEGVTTLGENSNELRSTLREFMSSRQNYEKAIASSRHATSLDRTIASGWITLGQAHELIGQPKLAIAVYDEAIDNGGAKSAELYNALGRLLSDHGNNARAILILRKAVELDPSDAEAWTNLGVALRREGLVEEARSAFWKALEQNPDHYWANHLLARLLVIWREWDEVAFLEQRAVASAPDNISRGTSLALQARANIRLRDRDAACTLFLKAYSSHLHSEGLLEDMMGLECPSVYWALLAQSPDDYWATHVLAIFKAKNKQWEEVAYLEHRALNLAPEEPWLARSMVLLAKARQELNEPEAACSLLRRAYRIAPTKETLDLVTSFGCAGPVREKLPEASGLNGDKGAP